MRIEEFDTIVERLAKGRLWDFPGGVHPEEKKYPSNQAAIGRCDMPEQLILPVKQHIGVEGRLLVSVGEHVLKGQKLTHSAQPFAVPVHAPTSGDIIAIENRIVAHPSGLTELTVVIAPDGKDEWCELQAVSDFQQMPNDIIVAAICEAGISGMGGAGFPTHIKANASKPVEFLIVNGIECEPYITSDDRLMREHAWQIRQGIDVLAHIAQPKMTIVAIEDNKPEAIKAMQIACQGKDDFLVVSVPTKYPAGGEKQLIQVLTNREVPGDGLPADIGIVMFNVGTCYAVADAIYNGKPLVERVVTVTGNAVSAPQNFWALLGTPVGHLLQQAGYAPAKQAAPQVIMGGPMMGFAVPTAEVPVVKTTNCLLVPGKDELTNGDDERACIRCSECADACPVSLLPQQMYWYAKASDHDKVQEYNLFDCIECGACAYVCPSEIPLVHYYRKAKSEIRIQRDEKSKAEKAKARFESRNDRLERDKKEREEKHRLAAEARKKAQQGSQTKGPSDKVAAALARAKAKKAQSNDEVSASNTQTKSNVAAAIARAKAKKAQQTDALTAEAQEATSHSATAQNEDNKAKAAAIIARAKAKKAQDAAQTQQNDASEKVNEQPDKKAKIAAAIAKAKAKQAEYEANQTADDVSEDSATNAQTDKLAKVAASEQKAKRLETEQDPNNDTASPATVNAEPESSTSKTSDEEKKAKIAAAVARAKAKKNRSPEEQQPAQPLPSSSSEEVANASDAPTSEQETDESQIELDDKQAKIAAAVAKAKANKAKKDEVSSKVRQVADDDKQAKIAAAVAKAKAKKLARQQQSSEKE